MKSFLLLSAMAVAVSAAVGSCGSSSTAADSNITYKVEKLLKSPSLRKPAPVFMTSDNECLSCLYSIAKLDSIKLGGIADSAKARYEENVRIAQYIDSIGQSGGSFFAVREEIRREALRYDEFVKLCRIEEANRLCDKKTMPEGRLVEMDYFSQGMAFNPFSPLTIKTGADGKSVLNIEHLNKKVVLEDKVMDDIAKIIESEKIYTLHPSYRRIEPDLPGIEKMIVLDEGIWSFSAIFSDGSEINSAGQGPEPSSVYKIIKYLRDSLELDY